MNKLILLTTSALVAFGASFPAFADSATITQTNETNGTANQHQGGIVIGVTLDDTATIVQANGNGDVATQEQARLSFFNDAELLGTETITQTGNTGAVARQEQNAEFDTQTITQTGTTGTTGATGGQVTGQVINVAASQSSQAPLAAVTALGILAAVATPPALAAWLRRRRRA